MSTPDHGRMPGPRRVAAGARGDCAEVSTAVSAAAARVDVD
ncbi:hypothetical protein [Burkholderia ubonensis]|nr:hypothetical protein [Burkholderia ubonensis]